MNNEIKKSKHKNRGKKIFFVLLCLILIATLIVTFLSINKPTNTGEKENLTIAVVGHQGHGKTTLTSAITKQYGTYIPATELRKPVKVTDAKVTYYSRNVEYDTDTRHYKHYDLQANEDYEKALNSGSLKLDGAILVIAADEGLMSQTIKQLEYLKKAKVSKVVVYINKCDLYDDINHELIDLVEMETREILDSYGFDGDNTPVIRGSATKAIEDEKIYKESIKELIKAVDTWIK